MKRNNTIKDIAELAGVSKGTVDRVLHKRGKVSKKAMQKVNAVLSEIDYQPNFIARSLKNNKVYQICVLLPDANKDQYWQPCNEGIKQAVLEFKTFNISIKTFVFDPVSIDSFLEESEAILDTLPDAILMAPLFQKEALAVIEKFNKAGILVNTFNNEVASNTVKGFVGQDLFQSGRVAANLMDLLLNKGEIVIIHIDEDFENAIFMQEKEKGFRNYFNEISNSEYTISTCKLKYPNFEGDLTDYINAHPKVSGIFVTTSKAYRVAEISSKNQDNNIAIVGYDLLDENIEFLKNGKINFLINQNPKRQIYLGITYLAEHFPFDKVAPVKKLLPIGIINSENFKAYLN